MIRRKVGIIMYPEAMVSLENNGCIDDSVISAFLEILRHSYKDHISKIFVMDLFQVQHNFMNPRSDWRPSFIKWVSKIAFFDYKIWILPVGGNDHWTLLVVIPKLKILLYHDSYYGMPSDLIINSVCEFIETYLTSHINWDEWTLHVPNDIPYQATNGLFQLNCGVHLCSWAYVIFSGTFFQFSDSNRCQTSEKIWQTF